MFSSAGYFRSANCPFFLHGLCHRPYCHFRHAKPGNKNSSNAHGTKSSSSNKQTKKKKYTPNKQPPGIHTRTESNDIIAMPNADHISPEKDKTIKEPHPQTTAPSILDSINKLEQAVEEVSASLLSRPKRTSYCSESSTHDAEERPSNSTKDTSAVSKDSGDVTNQAAKDVVVKSEAIDDSLDDDTPIIVDYKENVKKVIYDTIELSSGDEAETSNADKVGSEGEKLHTKRKHTISSLDRQEQQNQQESPNLQENINIVLEDCEVPEQVRLEDDSQNKVSTKAKLLDIPDIVNVAEGNLEAKELKEIKKEKNNDRNVKSTEQERNIAKVTVYNKKAKKSVSIDKQTISSDKHKKSTHMNNEVKKSVSLKIKKEKNTEQHNKIASAADKVEEVNEYHSVNIKKEKKDREHKSKKISENIADMKVPEKISQQCDHDRTSVKTHSSKEKEHAASDGTKTKKKVTVDKALADVDFFSCKDSKKKKLGNSSKKTSESELSSAISKKEKELELLKMKAAKRKADKSPSSTKKAKISRHEEKPAKDLHSRNLFGIESDDSHHSGLNDIFSDDDGGVTEQLKEIFDEFDPSSIASHPLKISLERSKKEECLGKITPPAKRERLPSATGLQGLGKKQRVAHSPKHLSPRLSSNANPIRRYPKTIAPSQSPIKTNAAPSESTVIDPLQAKRRIAHAPKTQAPKPSPVKTSKPNTRVNLPRPRIPLEYGAKVPQNIRQRYLDKIIDEHLRLCRIEKVAYEKALEEESQIYNRATRRHMYINLCINSIKKLRATPISTATPELTSSTSSATSTASDNLPDRPPDSDKQITQDSALTEETFYNLLCTYRLTEEELVQNGFPRPTSTPGKVVFKPRKVQKVTHSDPNRRTCHRCGKPYSVLDDGTHMRHEECVYHVGRLLRRRVAGEVISSYTCCDGDAASPGCAVGKVHVSEGKNVTEGFMTTIVSPLSGNLKKVFSLDCEMCYTKDGLELTRVTVVDWKLDNVYDTFVRPDNPILDYNTRFSGVTEECLRGVTTSLREVQAVLLSMIHRDTILVGHSLESDLIALKLVHSSVVDTSVVFPHRLGPPYKRALRNLTAEHLKQIIQDNEAGHDSYEDSKACLELMLHKAQEDLKKKERHQ